jgi:hypothetical protein
LNFITTAAGSRNGLVAWMNISFHVYLQCIDTAT